LQDATRHGVLTFGRLDTTAARRAVLQATRHDDTMSKIVFSPSEDKTLVQEVQKNPILYKIEEVDYRNIM